ncbi:MAG: hypothetical protein HW389_3536 [Bacteroidetes bacterium]|nr:hypothetical protein [Bacteroidota bacterium]
MSLWHFLKSGSAPNARPPRKESWQSLPVRFEEIKQLIKDQTDYLKEHFSKPTVSWTKQPKSADDHLEERLKGPIRAIFAEAFQQQLGTNGPGQVKQMLESIQRESKASIKSEVGKRSRNCLDLTTS